MREKTLKIRLQNFQNKKSSLIARFYECENKSDVGFDKLQGQRQ